MTMANDLGLKVQFELEKRYTCNYLVPSSLPSTDQLLANNVVSKQESQLLESLSSAKLELAKVRSDAELESTGLHQIQHKSISSKNEFEKLSKQLEDNRAEVDRSQRLLLSVKSTAESHEKDLSEKRRQRAQLTGELNILGEAVQMGRIGKKAVDEEREASESALQNTLGQLNQAKSDKRQMEQVSKVSSCSPFIRCCFLQTNLA
ncbi:hypothetical protein AHF37_10350 [Paragonimus kellicotti]|nr:hypothetical protein AHF37_10350 [Paragonimus kellicotti]